MIAEVRNLLSIQNHQIQETLHKIGKEEIKEAKLEDISLFTVKGKFNPRLQKVLEKLLIRTNRNIGLDLRELKEIGIELGHTLRKVNTKQKVRNHSFLLYSPQARVVELLELSGGIGNFSIFDVEAGCVKNKAQESQDSKSNEMQQTSDCLRSNKIVRLAQDMEQTRRIQQSLDTAGQRHKHVVNSELPDFEPIELYRHCSPCETVGGDFYLYQQLDEEHLGIAIGDVSGHGIEAALLMGMTRKVLEIRAKDLYKQGAAAIVKQVNKDLHSELDRYSFVTAFYGILNSKTGHFQYARVGHNYPLLFSPAAQKVHQLSGSGLAFGLDNGSLFDVSTRDHEVFLQQGDYLVIYTDGITEAMSPTKGMYGIERLEEFVQCSPPNNSATELGKSILQEIDKFSESAPLEDDLTLLCLRYVEELSQQKASSSLEE